MDDIEAWKKKFSGLEIEFVVGTMGEGFMQQIYFKDPSGNMVELVQHLRDDWWKEF